MSISTTIWGETIEEHDANVEKFVADWLRGKDQQHGEIGWPIHVPIGSPVLHEMGPSGREGIRGTYHDHAKCVTTEKLPPWSKHAVIERAEQVRRAAMQRGVGSVQDANRYLVKLLGEFGVLSAAELKPDEYDDFMIRALAYLDGVA